MMGHGMDYVEKKNYRHLVPDGYVRYGGYHYEDDWRVRVLFGAENVVHFLAVV